MTNFIHVKDNIINLENVKWIEKSPVCITVYLKEAISSHDFIMNHFNTEIECKTAYDEILDVIK